MINIGIIGTGFGAKVQVPGFRAVRGARVLGIAGRSAAKTAAVAKELDIPRPFSSWKKLIDDPKIDVVSIVSPPRYHKEMALYAAHCKKHIFCEKPLAMSATAAKKMLSAVKRAGVVHGIDFEFRNLPGLVVLRGLLAKKTIGGVRHARIAWLTGSRASTNIPLSWQNRKKEGGGVLFSHCSHVIDYMELLFGKIKSVSARLTVAKKNGADAEDTCDMLFRLANGATASVTVSNVLPGASTNMIEVYGDKGSLRLENYDPKDPDFGFRLFHFSLASNKEKEISLKRPKKSNISDTRVLLFRQTAEKFIRAIEKKKKTVPSFVDGLRAQMAMDAVRISDRSGREVLIR